MANRKPQSARSKSAQPSKASKPPPKQPTRLENLAARKHASGSFDDLTLDDQLVDNSGVFRVTSAIAQAQTGHDEDSSMRFPSDSLAMQAQRDGFRDDGPTIDEAVDESAIEDEATRAERKARLATLAARARHQQQLRRR